MTSLLKQKKIMVTRERRQAHVFSQQIIANGGIPIEVPLLNIDCHLKATDQYLLRDLSTFAWIFFTSANGVHCFFKKIRLLGIAQSELKRHQFAVVGPKTEQALQSYGFYAHFVPSIYNAETMANEFVLTYPVTDSILLVQGSLSRPTLRDQLIAHQLSVDCVDVYKTVIHKASKQLLNERLQENIDFITFTSPSTVDAFVKLIDEPLSKQVVCVSIGTTTDKRARDKGFQRTLIPDQFTIEGMIEKMGNYLAEEGYV